MSKTLYSGVAKVVITPSVGTELLAPKGYCSTGIHDDLFCRALVLKDKKEELAFVSMDLVGLDFGLLEDLRQIIQQDTGLSSRKVMLHCTHTHNSPVSMCWRRENQLSRNRVWEKELGKKISEAILKARDNLLPSKVGVGREKAKVGVNRRLPTDKGVVMRPFPLGPVAPYVDVLRIVNQEGMSVVLFCHAAHPISAHNATTLITADYPGYAVQRIQRSLKEDVFPIFSQGCCGNVNSNPASKGFSESEKLGAALGKATAKACLEIDDSCSHLPLRTFHQTINLPLLSPPSYQEAKKILIEEEKKLEEVQRKNADRMSLYWHKEEVLWARDLAKLCKQEKSQHTLPMEIQVFVMGREIALIGLSHEVFVQYQLRIQEESPFTHTLVLAYTNGVAGYIPTPEDFPLGGYEVLRAAKSYGALLLNPQAGEIMFRSAMELLSRAHNS